MLSNASAVASINQPSVVSKLQLALPCEPSKFGSLTYPIDKQFSDQVCVFKGKVLTLNEGLAMAPLSIPEQPAVVQLERNRVYLTRRKSDATVSEAFPSAAMQHMLAPAVGARF